MSWLSAHVVHLIIAGAAFSLLAAIAGHQEAVEANGVAEQAKGRASEANEAAAKANERAAELNKTAEQLRLDLEKERSKTAARPWAREQFDAIQDIKGVVKGVGILWKKGCTECNIFAQEIAGAFIAADIQIYGLRPFDYEASSSTGIFVWLPEGSDLQTHPLVVALGKAQLTPIATFHPPFNSSVRNDIPVIFVGERFPSSLAMPYFPPGITHGMTILPIEQ